MLFEKGLAIEGGFLDVFSRHFIMSDKGIFASPIVRNSLSTLCWVISVMHFFVLFVESLFSSNLVVRFVFGREWGSFDFEVLPVRLM